ncbi:MAG: phosphomannomutase/phosphoglucomutase [Gemmatimonadetes bacterium]|jgi:phosphomannomutase|nr:phosphomannomutase/phosphoglucomutase [Gemmatimonadota bacterium]MBT5327899.1 phosphomannomutase/phosphoglucomutase [Gemmatimonadota bacterium]MBT5449574.1 phosphomannomutase/phosphoglucomutase [Gemmatimonadota bacterium]MBT5804869.1 phosphomannomutase/phosphoglucomutase [Gemmatimonadota bacterium]MBT6622147.1 phosphomannomutase/phosphoglucomutase [Gemmatimonadota bacterium]
MQVDPSIFKAYDIRGVYPDPLNEEVAYAVGRAFVTLLACEEVVVGRDMRLSSPAIKEHLIRGLTEQGADVVDIGMVGTDQYYHACATLGRPGLMVTASHNPPEYCGFKMVRNMPYLLSGDSGIQDLRHLVEEEGWGEPLRSGEVRTQDVSQGFIDKVLELVDPTQIKPLKVVADTGNGMVGPILQRVYDRLPVELIGIYLDPDGSLPNHGLDPMQPENRADLERRVIEEGADIGFAFDGDGDRFFIVDDRGHFVPGDFVTALMGCYMLERDPGGKVVYDVRCSWAVPDLIKQAGGTPLVERVGHSFLKPRIFEEGAVYAGELSGHYYFREFYGADSGIVPSLVMLEMLSKRGVKLSELLAPLESKYFLSSEINSRVDDPLAKIEALAKRYGDGAIERIDGITISFDDWHFNVRPSNTEPLLRLNLEALSQGMMEQKRDEVLEFIRS